MRYPKITLLGEPKSTQHIYKITCRPFPSLYLTPEGKAIKEDYAWQGKSQWRGLKPIDVPLGLTVNIYHKTKRKQDLDNFNKLWQDGLNRICYTDDNLIQEMHLFKHHDPLSPRIEIDFFLV
ncbi:MAG: hypothetical protein COZ74_13910 [Flavobacteriaceae bacterium CG_4_8_14_3_um_filter_31_8]|nr:MAG: hypothetical protein COZ74_13910 [Flavobacteriaceae bacterium CG_4_8_14_3_um_filter_31_8]